MMLYPPEINPSILSADFRMLGHQLDELGQVGARVIHVDVMDGHFVPNLTYGPVVLQSLNRTAGPAVWDVHLMVSRPEVVAPWFLIDRVKRITVHGEVTAHLHRLLVSLTETGREAGVSLVPSTPISTLEHVLEYVEQVLIMTVNPGFGGQKFIEPMVEKIAALAELRNRRGLGFHIQVDGGIDLSTIPKVVAAGADRLVVGNALFSAPDLPARFLELQQCAKDAAA